MKLIAALLFLCLLADPVQAGFIGAAIAAVSAGLSAGAVWASAVVLVGRLVLSVAIAAYQKRRMKKKLAQAQQQSGITTQFVGTGGTTPLTLIVGRYATAGHLEAPQMSHGREGGAPNAWLTYVVGLGDVAGIVSTGRVVINDRWYNVTAAQRPDLPGYGFMVDGDIGGNALFTFRSGNETAADPWLLSVYGSYPDRPWLNDMVGRGVPHVIVNLFREPTLFPGEPRLRFEVLGIPLYDPRRDSSVGGSGTQRWDNPATWDRTDNPKVIEYNIHRGITIEGFGVWGNTARAEDLPLDNWFAAMNACDLLVDNGAGGTEKAYVFGFEWGLDTEPRQIIDEINRSCAGETVEVGGIWKTRVGGVGLPVFFFTDGDVLVSRAQELDPFPGLDATFNAVSCSFPDPNVLWEAREAPPFTNATWEAEDGLLDFDEGIGAWVRRPRRLLREVSLPAVSNPRQVQRLMSSIAREGRKRITHVLTLTPEALALEPLDAVAWTSTRNGYVGKVFDVVLTADPVTTLRPRIGLLEADPNDYTPPPFVPLPIPSTINPAFAPHPVIGFAVEPIVLTGSNGIGRRPALRLLWNGEAMSAARGLSYEVRLGATGAMAAQGTVQDVESGSILVTDVLPDTDYQVRAKVISDRPNVWTLWIAVRTPAQFLSTVEFDEAVNAALTEAMAVRAAAAAELATAVTDLRAYSDEASADLAAAVGELREYTDASFAVEIPRVVNTEAALDLLATQVSWLVAAGAQTNARLADAGLYLDPETGKARLEAVSRIDGQLTQVGVTLDGIAGQLSLKVTQADVDLAIAAAQLDPAELPIIGALVGRVTDLEVSLDAAEAAIEQRATVIEFGELDTTVTNATTRIDALEAEIVQKVEVTTFTLLEERVSTAEITLGALDGAGLTIQVSDLRQRVGGVEDLADATLAAMVQAHEGQMAQLADTALVRQEYSALVTEERTARASLRTELAAAIDANTAQIVAEQTASADADQALALQIAGLSATVGDNTAAITAEQVARSDADSALSGRIDTVTATAGDNAAAISAEVVARTDADSALSGRIDSLTATVGDNTAAISAESLARAGEDEALAGLITALTATVGGNTAAINDEVIARAGADDALSGRINSLTATVGDNTAAISAETVARADAVQAIAGQIDTISSTLGSTTAAAAAAQEAAQEAYDLADGKGAVFYGPAPAPVSWRASTNLWIRTDGGLNQPYRWDGTSWQPVTDKAATDAAAAAASALGQLADKADASVVNALTSRVSTAEGTITSLADSTSTLTARVEDTEAEVSQQGTAIATLEGRAIASLVLRARAGGAAGEIEVVAADDPTGPPISSVVIRSDRFKFEGNLAQFLGTVKIDNAIIGNAAVDTLQIAGRAVTEPAISLVDYGGLNITTQGFITFMSLAIVGTGIPTFLSFSVSLDAATGTSTVEFAVRRNGVLIAVFQQGAGLRNGVSFMTYDPGAPPGLLTYTVDVRLTTQNLVRIYQCGLTAVQYRR